eukprot:3581242-Rhodomonas_salina.1
MAASGLGGLALVRRNHSSACSVEDGVVQAHRPRLAAQGLLTPVSSAMFHVRGSLARHRQLAMSGQEECRTSSLRVASVAEGSEMSLELVDFIVSLVTCIPCASSCFSVPDSWSRRAALEGARASSLATRSTRSR